MSFDWKGALKSVAPALGTAIGGPLGGAAATFIAGKLGLKESTIEAVGSALNASKLTPEQIVQVKDAEIEFKKFCKTNDLDLEKIAAEDRGSARNMQIQTRSKMPAILTIMITLGFFGVLGAMLYDDSIVNSPPLLIMLGSLGTAWTGACAFWFGTTSNSQNKTNLLANSAPVK
jgi:hypothetical protein